MFSFDTFVNKKANGLFSPFSKPKGLAAKFAFIRLGISEASLRQGLATPKARVYQAVEALRRIPDGARLRVTSAAGTDLTLQVQAFGTCEHEIAENGGMAFLPASEISAEVIGGSAEGRIAVDVTVGQLYRFGELLGNFGRVAEPVVLTVRGGVIADVSGGAAAAELKEKLFALHTDCRKLVELGFGLSNMEPTGLIGVDESIIGTCHFGLGDGGECGVHLDLVVSAPEIASVVSGERAAVIQ